MTTLEYETPVWNDEPCSAGIDRTRLHSQDEASATVLLAEDDVAVRGFIDSVLRQAGFQVLIAENGRQALELFKRHSSAIRVLITDVIMPEVNGRELAEMARAVEPGLKVLFVSGYVDRSPKEVGRSNGSNGFLEKPFTAECLLDSLAKLGVLCPDLST